MGDSLDAMKVIQQQAPLVVEHKQEQVQEQQMLLADPAQQQMKEQKTAAPKAKREKKRRKISVFDKKKPQAVTQAAAPLQAEQWKDIHTMQAVSYHHLRAHETRGNIVCRLQPEKKIN